LKRKLRITLIATAALVFIAAVAGGYYVLRAKRISWFGIALTPSRDFETREVTYYLQNDPEWARDKIGNTSRTMGSAGCLISCVASAITDLGVTVTPAELNEKLTAIGGYSGADLIWYKIHEAIPEVNYTYSRTFTAGTTENGLAQGRQPAVNPRSGVNLFVFVQLPRHNLRDIGKYRQCPCIYTDRK
jgi:hypothetical protein